MLLYAGRRLLAAIPLLLVVPLLIFLLIDLAPGDPAVILAGENPTPDRLDELRSTLMLDQNVFVRYLDWLGGVLRGDLGTSLLSDQSVSDLLLRRMATTLSLVAFAMVLAVIIGVVLGVLASLRPGGLLDRVINVVASVAIAIPAFWFGLVLQLVFAASLGWLPSSGRVTPGDGGVIDRVQHLVLPATVLATLHAAAWTRYLRASMVAAFDHPFVTAARARGIPERRILVRYVMRAALLPLVTVVLLDAALLVSGAVVTESVFAWPGLGTLFTEALARRDYAVLMAMVMLASGAIVVMNLVADLVYQWLDPRVTP